MSLPNLDIHTCNPRCAGREHYEVFYATTSTTCEELTAMLQQALDPACVILRVREVLEYRRCGGRYYLNGLPRRDRTPVLCAFGVTLRWGTENVTGHQ